MRSGWQKSDIEGDEVLGIGGFWCGSYRPEGCCVGVPVTLFTASRSGVLSTKDVHQLKVVVSSEAKLQGCELLMSCFERWARVRLGGLEGVMHNGTEPMRVHDALFLLCSKPGWASSQLRPCTRRDCHASWKREGGVD